MHHSILKEVFTPLNLCLNKHSFFFNAWKEITYTKGDLITEAGFVEKYFYVVLYGVQAIYVIHPNGDKKILGFSFNGSFSGVYDSFLKQYNSLYYLEALTPSRLLRIDKEVYDKLFILYPEFNVWGRVAHQELLIGRAKREVELITMTAKERFEVFSKRCPKELLSIPQKYLASYLNMTPETYSRLRKSIS